MESACIRVSMLWFVYTSLELLNFCISCARGSCVPRQRQGMREVSRARGVEVHCTVECSLRRLKVASLRFWQQLPPPSAFWLHALALRGEREACEMKTLGGVDHPLSVPPTHPPTHAEPTSCREGRSGRRRSLRCSSLEEAEAVSRWRASLRRSRPRRASMRWKTNLSFRSLDSRWTRPSHCHGSRYT